MKKSKKILLLAAAAAVLVGIVLAGFVAQYYLDNRRPNFQKEYVLYVYPDMTQDQVLDTLSVRAGMMERSYMEKAFEKAMDADTLGDVTEKSERIYVFAKEQGKGAVALRGKMIDAPIVMRAEQTIAMAEELGLGRSM